MKFICIFERFIFFLIILIFNKKNFFMNVHEVYEYFWIFFLFLSHKLIFHSEKFFFMNFHEVYKVDFLLQKIFLWMFMKFMSIFERFFFFSLIYWFLISYIMAQRTSTGLENSSSTYRTSQLFGLFRLFKSYEFFNKRLHFSSSEKALIDTSNLSISFVLIKFVIVFVKIRFLSFTMLFEKFEYLIWFKSYEFFSKCLHFRKMGVIITKNKIFV